MLINPPWSIDPMVYIYPRYITYPGVMPGMYTIDHNGNVYNIVNNFYVSVFENGQYLKCHLMRADGSQYVYYIHRLVAWEWVYYNRDFNLVVNHKDGNKLNNNCNNLEWVTTMENVHHAMRTGLTPAHPNQGEKHGMTKLTNDDVHKICQMLQDPKVRYEEVAAALGNKVTAGTIESIINGGGWPHITCQYNIPKRSQGGECHNMAKFTDADVHMICRMLQDPKVKYEDVAAIFNGRVSVHAVIDIAHGRTWTNISSQYNIPKRTLKGLHAGENHNMAKLTEEDVHKICRLLQNTDMKYKEIVEEMDNKISVHTVCAIFKGKVWNNISCKYNFSARAK